MKRDAVRIALAATVLYLASGCGGSPESGSPGFTDGSPAPKTDASKPLFLDVTKRVGIDFRHRKREQEHMPPVDDAIGASVVVLDYNGDGLPDLFLTNSNGPNALYKNVGGSAFEDVASVAGVDDPKSPSNGGCAADYDNDGLTDLYLTNDGLSRLFRNKGDGTFMDVTEAAGLATADRALRTTGCAWADYDLDGHLDLVVTRHFRKGRPRTGDDAALVEPTDDPNLLAGLALYRNQGSGVFQNTTSLLGDVFGPKKGKLPGNIWGPGFQPGWVDLDNDGDVDLYVINDLGELLQPNVLWRNDGPSSDGRWRFTDVSEASGADVVMFGMGLAVGDYNLDGLFDLYITNIGDNVLLENTGRGLAFTDVAAEAGVSIGRLGGNNNLRVTWGAAFFDYDNDGDEDLYVVSGYMKEGPPPPPADGSGKQGAQTFQPVEQDDVLLRNEGGGVFVDVSPTSGAADRGVGRGASYLDFNDDGCLDVVVARAGDTPLLYQNTCVNGNNWLAVEPIWEDSGSIAIGARVDVVANGVRQIREVAAGSSYMGQSQMQLHFGLGAAAEADSVTIRWPNGTRSELRNVPANQKLRMSPGP